ncbi:MAG TPA: response regulator [Anaerolineae bacterium]|nr:response regulator [Anaerolineae bacterium]
MGKKILVVDDSPFIVRSLAFILKKHGYEIVTATDGEEALAKIREERPDLVFLDVMMPEKDGYEVCREVRGNPEMGNPYIIMLTARGQEADRERGLRLGADEFMTKPFSPSQVIERVKAVLG